MHPLVGSKRAELALLCREFRVRRLEVFGSAATDGFHPETSDLDFLVEFQELEPSAYADAYFGLLEALERLFRRPVDLVMSSSITNPFFRESIDRHRLAVYAA